LAKEATTLNPISDEISFAYLGTEINQLKSKEWINLLISPNINNPSAYINKYPWKIGRKLQIPIGTKRELASSFYQLKLGHGYIKSYLFKLGHTSSNKCDCGQIETPEHLILSCKKLNEARKELKSNIGARALTLPLLMHTKLGISHLLVFLQNTKICTRKWHLERAI
jgi:hypothetical protein